jgi:hypothetical protein
MKGAKITCFLLPFELKTVPGAYLRFLQKADNEMQMVDDGLDYGHAKGGPSARVNDRQQHPLLKLVGRGGPPLLKQPIRGPAK